MAAALAANSELALALVDLRQTAGALELMRRMGGLELSGGGGTAAAFNSNGLGMTPTVVSHHASLKLRQRESRGLDPLLLRPFCGIKVHCRARSLEDLLLPLIVVARVPRAFDAPRARSPVLTRLQDMAIDRDHGILRRALTSCPWKSRGPIAPFPALLTKLACENALHWVENAIPR
eukprot:3712483-Amphidinium_carterae.2